MITKKHLEQLQKQGLIASVRVVPVPLTQVWCIDLVVRTPMEAGSTTDTVSSKAPSNDSDKLRRFESLDATASFLRECGISTFTVDTDDAFSFVNVDGQAVRVVERTMRLWKDEDSRDERADEDNVVNLK